MIIEKLKKLKKKGFKFYLSIQIDRLKRNNVFFGWLFQKMNKYYKVGELKIDVGKDLFPLSLYSRFYFGIYEKEEVTLLNKYINGDESVLELGACIGVVSCKTNSLLNRPENQISVEANPDLISYLEKNKEINDCKFKVLNGIVSDEEEISFYIYEAAFSGSTFEKENSTYQKEVKIEGFNPHQLEQKYGIKIDTLIMDIEGGEFEFIENFKTWLSNINKLFIEFHPIHIHEGKDLSSYLDILREECNFSLYDSMNGTYVFLKRELD